jgi:UDP:flavonoid glycosyltransferase YjiC (YdhE family)
MSEILFVTWDGGGNVPPALAIADELVTRGHRVRFLGHTAQREALAARGYPPATATRSRAFSSQDDNSPLDMIAAFGDRGQGRDVLAELARRPADLVVVDCLLFGVMDALRRSGTPYVVLEHLYDDYLRRSWLRGPLGIAMGVRRLHPRRCLDAAALTLVTTLPELDPASRRSHAHRLAFVGPVVETAPRVPAEPTVLVSLSTFAFPGMADCLQRILDAAGTLDARVVVTTGPVIDPGDLRLPANAEAHRYVPHAELMSRATLVVGHGGHGTTMQALAHDLPVVVMPLHPFVDQPMVGASLERAGAGRVVRKKAPATELAPVLAAMLTDGPHRTAAARLGAAIRSLPGATNGAGSIESLLSNAAPAPGRPSARR